VCVIVQIDHREFRVTGAVDSLTARPIDASEARARAIVVDGGGLTPTSPDTIRSPRSSSSRDVQSPVGSAAGPWDDDDNLSTEYEYYLVEATGERIPLLQAIDAGWVFIEYENRDEQPEVQVGSVICQQAI